MELDPGMRRGRGAGRADELLAWGTEVMAPADGSEELDTLNTGVRRGGGTGRTNGLRV